MSNIEIPSIRDLPEVKDTLNLKGCFACFTYPTNNSVELVLSTSSIEKYDKYLDSWKSDRCLVLTSTELVLFRLNINGTRILRRRLNLSDLVAMGLSGDIMVLFNKRKPLILRS